MIILICKSNAFWFIPMALLCKRLKSLSAISIFSLNAKQKLYVCKKSASYFWIDNAPFDEFQFLPSLSKTECTILSPYNFLTKNAPSWLVENLNTFFLAHLDVAFHGKAGKLLHFTLTLIVKITFYVQFSELLGIQLCSRVIRQHLTLHMKIYLLNPSRNLFELWIACSKFISNCILERI